MSQQNKPFPMTGRKYGPPASVDLSAITIEQVKACVPLNVRKHITPKMMDQINTAMDDSIEKERFRENFLSWVDVISMGRYKFQDYINAVKYVSFKLMGHGNTLAYSRTFPDRYQRMVNRGYDARTIAAHTSMYNSGDIVSKILERTLVPVWVINSDVLQEAINTQAELMRSAKSETVRHKAAANLIEHLKKPEAIEVDISVGVSNDTVEDLRNVTRALAVQQKRLIEGGHLTASDVGSSQIIKKENEVMADVVEAEFEVVVKKEMAKIEKPMKGRKNRLVEDFYRNESGKRK